MEALGGVASGFAVASLPIQLVESVDKVRALIRNVKGAKKELRRLSSLLMRLGAVLLEIKDLLEHQASAHRHNPSFPDASPAIASHLQCCKETLAPLQELLEKHQSPDAQSAIFQLKKDISLGLKAKEIAFMESRIQDDIERLNTALGANNYGILTKVLPILLQNSQIDVSTTSISLHTNTQSCVKNTTTDSVSSDIDPGNILRPLATVTTVQTHSSLFGIRLRHRRTTKHLQSKANNYTPQDPQARKGLVKECNEYTLSWSILSRAMVWTHERPFGGIAPYIRVYPIIGEDPTNNVWNMMKTCSVEEFQEKITMGEIHPYSRTKASWQLVHCAAYLGRLDLCLLLHNYGVTADCDDYGRHPLHHVCTSASSSNILEISQALLLMTDGIGNQNEAFGSWGGPKGRTFEYFRWLWDRIADIFDAEDIFDARIKVIRAMIRHSVVIEMPDIRTELRIGLVIEMIESGSCELLSAIWGPETPGDYYWRGPWSSHEEGKKIIAILKALGVDLCTWSVHEMGKIERGIMISQKNTSVMVVASCIDQKQELWDLHYDWTWDFEPRSQAYEVLSCYPNLAGPWIFTFDHSDPEDCPYTVESCQEIVQDWPYRRPWSLHSKHYRTRFQRRQTKHARKERARAGQKQPRIQTHMPGAWTFG